MSRTINGWTVDPRTMLSVVGEDSCQVRAGDAGRVLEWFAEEFHRTVEPVVTYNGYRTSEFNKSIGGAPNSNHISATAIDLNGARHPYEFGKYNPNYSSGFTSDQEKQIRRLLKKTDGVIFWGLDFNKGYRDAMHFEIRGTAAQVADLWKKIKPKEEDVKRKHFSRSKEQVVSPEKGWTTVRVRDNGGMSLLGEPSPIVDSEVSLAIAGVEPGREVQVRFIKVGKKNGKNVIVGKEMTQEAIGTSGSTFVKVNQKTSLSAGELLRVQIKVFGQVARIKNVRAVTDYQ